MASRRNSRYHIAMFVCSRYIITVCTSIRATSLYTEDEGERRWLPEGIPGITLLCLSVVDILLLSVIVSVIPVYIQRIKERGDGFHKEFQVSQCYICFNRYNITVCTNIRATA